MQVSKQNPGRSCPIACASEIVGDRWTLLIMREATIGATRFDTFHRRLGIAENILAARLRKLVDAGLLVRVPYRDGGRARVEYRLTEAGADLAPALRALGEWGHRHADAEATSHPMRVVHHGCGGTLSIDDRCDACGETVPREQHSWIRPSLSDEPIPLAPAWSGSDAPRP